MLFIYLSHFIIFWQPSLMVRFQRTLIFYFFFKFLCTGCTYFTDKTKKKKKKGFSEGANLYSFSVILSLQEDYRYKGNRNTEAARRAKTHLCRNLKMLPTCELNSLSSGS